MRSPAGLLRTSIGKPKKMCGGPPPSLLKWDELIGTLRMTCGVILEHHRSPETVRGVGAAAVAGSGIPLHKLQSNKLNYPKLSKCKFM